MYYTVSGTNSLNESLKSTTITPVMFFLELEVFDLKYFAENFFYINNGNRTEWSPIRSVINHTSDYQNRTTTKWESDLLIRKMVTDRIGRHKVPLSINQLLTFLKNIKRK